LKKSSLAMTMSAMLIVGEEPSTSSIVCADAAPEQKTVAHTAAVRAARFTRS
jgi:hypothetical protein